MSQPSADCARIGLLNLMPAPALPKTEHQWRDGFMGLADVVPIRFDDDPRMIGCRSAQFLDDHTAIGEVQDSLDGLIITGANLEVRPDGSEMPFDEIEYIDQLREVIDWAQTGTRLTVVSCLASHIALAHLYGIERDVLPQKVFGVYDHDITERSWLTQDISTPITAPHSRWGNVPAKLLRDAGITISAESPQVGWLLAQDSSGTHDTVFVQGHPEYWRDDLAAEYRRDAKRGQALPQNYFPNNTPDATSRYDWHSDASQLMNNIAGAMLQPVLVASRP